MQYLVLALAVLSAGSLSKAADDCPNTNQWTHGHVDPKPQTLSELQCTATGLTLTLTSPPAAWSVSYQVGYFAYPSGPNGPPGAFIAVDKEGCSATVSQTPSEPTGTTTAPNKPVTKKPIIDDPFGDAYSVRGGKADDTVVTEFSFDHGQCGGSIYGSDATQDGSSYGQDLVIRVVELLQTGIEGISFPTTTYVAVNCDNTVDQPDEETVLPDVKPESVEKCRECLFAISAKTLPDQSAVPDQIESTVTKGSCPIDPIFSWFLKSLKYNADTIVVDSAASVPLGQEIDTKVVESDGFVITTDLVVLDELRDLSIAAVLGFQSKDGLLCTA